MARQRQVHFWVSEGEFDVMQALAGERGESVAAFIRRLVRAYRLLYPDSSPHDVPHASRPVETGPRVFG